MADFSQEQGGLAPSGAVGSLACANDNINLVWFFVHRLAHHGLAVHCLIYAFDLVSFTFKKNLDLLRELERLAVAHNGGYADRRTTALCNNAEKQRFILIIKNSRRMANVHHSGCNSTCLIVANYVENIFFIIGHSCLSSARSKPQDHNYSANNCCNSGRRNKPMEGTLRWLFRSNVAGITNIHGSCRDPAFLVFTFHVFDHANNLGRCRVGRKPSVKETNNPQESKNG